MIVASRARGFTLVELMVAMVLTTVIVGIVIYGFDTSQRISKRAIAQLEIHGRMAPALALLERDANNAVLRDANSPVHYVTDAVDGYLTDSATMGANVTATPRHRIWFRYSTESNARDWHTSEDNATVARCELVFLTAMPVDHDSDGHADYRSGQSWVRWVAERTKVGDIYRLRLLRHLPRFQENTFFVGYAVSGVNHGEKYNQVADASPMFRSREIAGEDPENDTHTSRADADEPHSAHFDAERFFGAPQVLFELIETPELATAPVWNLFTISRKFISAYSSGGAVTNPADISKLYTGKANWTQNGSPAWDLWENPIGVHVDLEAYAGGGRHQAVRFRRTASFKPHAQ